VLLEVNLNRRSPVLNCGLPETFGSGIAKVPEQRLSDLTIIGLPATGVVSVVESASVLQMH